MKSFYLHNYYTQDEEKWDDEKPPNNEILDPKDKVNNAHGQKFQINDRMLVDGYIVYRNTFILHFRQASPELKQVLLN